MKRQVLVNVVVVIVKDGRKEAKDLKEAITNKVVVKQAGRKRKGWWYRDL